MYVTDATFPHITQSGTDTCTAGRENGIRYRHMIIIGVDGAGGFFREADTPNFDRIFTAGAYTYEALSARPSISAECWASMLTGVSPKLHGRTNERISTETYPKDSPYPTVYRRLRKAFPDATLAAFCDWSPILHGIVDDEMTDMLSLRDDELTPRCETYIHDNRPMFMFIHMDSTDHAGHEHGYGTPEHLSQIHVVDGYIGRIYDACASAGILEDTLFCVVSDHGGTCDPDENGGFTGTHGGDTDNERHITFAASGKGVASGRIRAMNIRDVAAVILCAFGVSPTALSAEGWAAQLPEGLFPGVTGPYRYNDDDLTDPKISIRQHTSEMMP